MRHILISSLLVLATITTAAASDRYPKAKRYVNQTGEVMVIGQASQIMEIAALPQRRALARVLPALQLVPVVKAQPAQRLVAVETPRSSVSDAVYDDSANWPRGRKCCRPGQPYFNEQPNS